MIAFLANKQCNKLGSYLFYLGIFTLPSAFFLSVIFLLISAIIGSFLNKNSYLKNNFNKVFLISGILILTSLCFQRFDYANPYRDILDWNLSFFGIFNWLPFFWLFWAFQPFLDTYEKRKKIAVLLISGTFPLIISGFGQYFFNWNGPFEALNGLLIWYQRPLESKAGLTSVFNNANYAGSWFNFVWPFCIALITEKSRNFFKKSILTIFLFSIGLSIFYTNSRIAWSGIFFSIPIVVGFESFYWILPLLIILLFLIFLTLSGNLQESNQRLLIQIFPENLLEEFLPKANPVSRIDIYISALKIISLRPMIGFGAASFPILYELTINRIYYHSHNLFLELALSYGYPVAILIITNISFIITISAIKLLIKNKQTGIIDRAWWASLFFFSISQLVDIQYFDGRLSILSWILLSGLNNIINENKDKVDLNLASAELG